MVATTQILQFDSALTNLQPLVNYQGSTIQTGGFLAGLVDPTVLNIILHQASFVASGIANFCVAQGVSVPDDGNLSNLVTELQTAIANFIIGGGTGPVGYVQIYNGNPNGHVAGSIGSAGVSSPTFCWDPTDLTLWVCTTSGNSASALWNSLTVLSPVNPSVTGTNYVYNSSDIGKVRVRSNGGAAMADTLPSTISNGWWVEIVNSDIIANVVVSVPVGKNLNGTLNGTIEVGPSQSISITQDASGNFWITAAPVPKINAAQATYITSSGVYGTGTYLVDTSSAPITVTLEAIPSTGDNYTFIDFSGTFSINNLVINPNGKTIQKLSENFFCDINGITFTVEYKSNNWSLQ